MIKEDIITAFNKNEGKQVSISCSDNTTLLGIYKKISDSEFEFSGVIVYHETKDEKNIRNIKFNIDNITHIRSI